MKRGFVHILKNFFCDFGIICLSFNLFFKYPKEMTSGYKKMALIQFQNQNTLFQQVFLKTDLLLDQAAKLSLLRTYSSKNKGSGTSTLHGDFSLLLIDKTGEVAIELLFKASLSAKKYTQKQICVLLALEQYELYIHGDFIDEGSLITSLPTNDASYADMVSDILNNAVVAQSISSELSHSFKFAA